MGLTLCQGEGDLHRLGPRAQDKIGSLCEYPDSGQRMETITTWSAPCQDRFCTCYPSQARADVIVMDFRFEPALSLSLSPSLTCRILQFLRQRMDQRVPSDKRLVRTHSPMMKGQGLDRCCIRPGQKRGVAFAVSDPPGLRSPLTSWCARRGRNGTLAFGNVQGLPDDLIVVQEFGLGQGHSNQNETDSAVPVVPDLGLLKITPSVLDCHSSSAARPADSPCGNYIKCHLVITPRIPSGAVKNGRSQAEWFKFFPEIRHLTCRMYCGQGQVCEIGETSLVTSTQRVQIKNAASFTPPPSIGSCHLSTSLPVAGAKDDGRLGALWDAGYRHQTEI
ncbi:hypothetical protein BaRGS_00013742 [Batillaria attramentaria]|uniref:Uncharacterized protein n=1 Tax=Batillaria attramentaria TaxID=370345 RepID=A0ABD0L7F2_9CAEN